MPMVDKMSRHYQQRNLSVMEIPKPLEDLILAHANLIPDGFSAFQEGNFAKAIELFNQALDQDKNNWKVRLHLAKSYEKLGDIYTAALHFRYLQQRCSDADIVSKSADELSALEDRLTLPKKTSEPSQQSSQTTQQSSGR